MSLPLASLLIMSTAMASVVACNILLRRFHIVIRVPDQSFNVFTIHIANNDTCRCRVDVLHNGIQGVNRIATNHTFPIGIGRHICYRNLSYTPQTWLQFQYLLVAQAWIEMEEDRATLDRHLTIGWPNVLQMVIVDYIQRVSGGEHFQSYQELELYQHSYLFSISSSPRMVSNCLRKVRDIKGAECITFRYPVISFKLSSACSSSVTIFSARERIVFDFFLGLYA